MGNQESLISITGSRKYTQLKISAETNNTQPFSVLVCAGPAGHHHIMDVGAGGAGGLETHHCP